MGWLSLDADDNDPVVLWSGVLGACDRAVRTANGRNDALAGLAPTRPITSGFLADFCHAVEALPTRLWLILDDVHELVTRDALDGLTRLLRNPPQNLKLMIGCRYDPPLPLARMMLNETAFEIRSADLAFDREETLTLLRSHHLCLDDHDVDLLLDRTEGWAAGLKLAALSLTRSDEPKAHLARFAGDERPVADYLVSEVLSHQTEATRDLLLAVAVPERLTIELADELSGRSDAGAVLEQLAHDNVLVYREDAPSPTYRLHSLLRSYLLAELDRRDAEAKRALHAKVSGWFDQHGLDGAALDHATKSADWAAVVHLLSQHGLQLVLSGDPRPVERALRLVPVTALDRPEISLLGAVTALSSGDIGSAQDYLDRALPRLEAGDDPDTRDLASAVLLYRSRVGGVRPAGEPSDGTAPLAPRTRTTADRPELGLLIAINHGIIDLISGDFERADTELSEALDAASRHHFDFLALDCMAHLAISAGAAGNAERTYARVRDAIDFADRRGLSSATPMVPVYLMAAWASWETLDLDGADTMVSLARAVDGDVEPQVRFSVEALQVYVDFVRERDVIGTRNRLRRVWDAARAITVPAQGLSKHCLTELQLAMGVRDGSWIDEVVVRADMILPDTADALVMHALADLHRGRWDHWIEKLLTMLAEGRCCECVSADIAGWLLAAHMADVNNQPSRAHDALIEALDRASPRDARRDVATSSDRVKRLLSIHRGRLGRHERFVSDVIHTLHGFQEASDTVPPFAGGEALTEREISLLHDLPSLLSLTEIADAHVVSLNTVKTHLKAIYRKLDVSSRRAAVERARVLGLL